MTTGGLIFRIVAGGDRLKHITFPNAVVVKDCCSVFNVLNGVGGLKPQAICELAY